MTTIKFARGTRTALDARAQAGTITPYQPYFLTGRNELAIGTTSSDYVTIGMDRGASKEILVPMYVDPVSNPTAWATMTAQCSNMRGTITAIANPADGPGTAAASAYTTVIANHQAAGGKVIGYILSLEGTRDIALMKADVDNWIAFYPTLDGIFVDEMSNDENAAHIALYMQIHDYIKAKSPNLRIVANPGINGSETYMPACDTMIVFEDTPTVFASYVQSAWNAKYPEDRFGMLFFGCAQADMDTLLPQVTAMGIKSVYFTNDVLSNP